MSEYFSTAWELHRLHMQFIQSMAVPSPAYSHAELQMRVERCLTFPTTRRHTVRKFTAEMPIFNGSSSPVAFRTFNAHCSRCGRQTVGHLGAPAEAELVTPFIVWCQGCAEAMERMCKSILAELQNPSKDDPIHDCGEEDLRHSLYDDRAIDRLFKLADQKLHVYPFNGVKMCWFRLYTDASIAKASKKIPGAQADMQHNAMPVEVINEVVSILDMALIMAGGVGRKEIIHTLLKELEAATEHGQALVPPNLLEDIPDDPNRNGERPTKRRKLDLQPGTLNAGSLTDEDYGGGTTEKEDWASFEAVGPGAKRLLPSGVDSSGFTPLVGDPLQNVPLQCARPDNGNGMVAFSESKPVAIAESQDDRLLVETVSVPSIRHPVQRLQTPSLSDFQKYMDVTAKPLVLTGAMQHWPALDRWNSKSYWLSKTFRGKRLVPIEIGRSYLDDGWGQKIVPFGTFLSDYLLDKSESEPTAAGGSHSGSSPLSSPPDSDEESVTVRESGEQQNPQGSAKRYSGSDSTNDEKEKGYLAQHDLFSQIPSLRSDVATPDYCFLDAPPPKAGTPVALKLSERRTKQSNRLTPGKASDLLGLEINDSDDGGTPKDIQSNIWFGPAWTITPLHHDPYHNILCQVVGKKYVRLFAPEYSQRLYPRGWEEATGSRAAARELPDEGRVVGQEQGKGHRIDMSNNSSIDVADMELSPAEDWDALWPGLSNVPYVECVLEAGEALYIPIGWWHYVRSCSIGISVSFWW